VLTSPFWLGPPLETSLRPAAVLVLACALPAQTPAPSPAPSAVAPLAAPEALSPEAMRSRERNVLIAVSTVLLAERTYAAQNGGFFDELRCLTTPNECLPDLPADTLPFLDPTYNWLEPRLGYARALHLGPKPSPDEIQKARASLTSVKSMAYTATPVQPGVSGTRAFCGDTGGRLCFTPDGREPPVKDGRCEPCKKME
jgi:hypothetical protein